MYKETGSLTAKDVKAVKEPQELSEPPQMPPKEAEAAETTPVPIKEQEPPQEEPESKHARAGKRAGNGAGRAGKRLYE